MLPSTFQTRTLVAAAPAIRVAVSAPFRQRLTAIADNTARLTMAVEEINNPNVGGPAGYAFVLDPLIVYSFVLPAHLALFAGGGAGGADGRLSISASEDVVDCSDPDPAVGD